MSSLIQRAALKLVRDTATEEQASRVRRFVASDESVDSHNSIIKASGWVLDRYLRNPVIQLFHDARQFPIGVGTARIEGKQLMIDVEFAPADDPKSGPDAEQALRWLDRGVMAVSVGFLPIEEEYDESRETGDFYQDLFCPPVNYLRQELTEVSIVNVGSNANSLPVGREVFQRAHNRFIARQSPAPKAQLTRAQLEELTKKITQEELQAHRNKQIGFLGGINK